jgi:RNA methyltransferase, TrmH family
MISKNKAKYIISLQKKKIRDEEKLYVIEGDKLVREFLDAQIAFSCLVAKAEFIKSLPANKLSLISEMEIATYEELKQISTLKTPHNAMGIIPMPERKLNITEIFKELSIALDSLQDPGNMGTIIRAAGWFGIKNIICSKNSVDVYNPKVIQASMGALLHVNVYYTDLTEFLIIADENNIPVFGSVLDGESIYTYQLEKTGIIVFGNESKGISDDLLPLITNNIMIPRFSMAKPGIDSLNVGMAVSVVLSEFKRRSQVRASRKRRDHDN